MFSKSLSNLSVSSTTKLNIDKTFRRATGTSPVSIKKASQNFYPPVDVQKFEQPVQPQTDLAAYQFLSHEQKTHQNYMGTAVQTADQRPSFAYMGAFDGTLHFKGVTKEETSPVPNVGGTNADDYFKNMPTPMAANGTIVNREELAALYKDAYTLAVSKENQAYFKERGELMPAAQAAADKFQALVRGPGLLIPPPSTKLLEAPRKLLMAPTDKKINEGWGRPVRDQMCDAEARPLTNIDKLLKRINTRQVREFSPKEGSGDIHTAFTALQDSKRVFILTGFNVDTDMPETDGPVGAAHLAHALVETKKRVIVVADKKNCELVKAALEKLNPKAAGLVTFEIMAERGEKAVVRANKLLNKYDPDTVLAIELAGRNAEGNRLNMRGVNINGFNADVDEVLNQANGRTMKDGGAVQTIGIGDGGNEAGMGGVQNVPAAENKELMQAAIPADHQVFSWNSNLGGSALAESLLASAGKGEKSCTPEQLNAMIEACLDAGAVDGVTRRRVKDEEVERNVNGTIVKGITGVDGHPTKVHMNDLKDILGETKDIPLGVVSGLIPEPGRYYRVAAFDSSAGGIVAAKNLAEHLEAKCDHLVNFTVVTDHGEAPYGPKSHYKLIAAVRAGLTYAQEVKGCYLLAMACNTACLSFPDSKVGLSENMVVLDLIDVTAEAIVRDGGERPVLLGTQATAKSPRYRETIEKYADEAGPMKAIPKVKMIGCGPTREQLAADPSLNGTDLASLINDLLHMSEDPKTKAEFRLRVKAWVKEIPWDATSVYLVCTHYPAVKALIQELLDECRAELLDDYKNGNLVITDRAKRIAFENAMAQKVEVRDPMVNQADKIVEELDRDASRFTYDTTAEQFRVITSAKDGKPRRDVEEFTKNILGDNVTVQQVGTYSNGLMTIPQPER